MSRWSRRLRRQAPPPRRQRDLVELRLTGRLAAARRLDTPSPLPAAVLDMIDRPEMFHEALAGLDHAAVGLLMVDPRSPACPDRFKGEPGPVLWSLPRAELWALVSELKLAAPICPPPWVPLLLLAPDHQGCARLCPPADLRRTA